MKHKQIVAGITINWLWKDSNARIYAEFHQNDSQNFRDLILDSDLVVQRH